MTEYNSTSKATRVTVTIGDIELNAYRLPDGKTVLAGRNVTSAIDAKSQMSLTRKLGATSLKTLPHADSNLSHVKSNTGESITPVAIEDAVMYWTIMAGEGNKKALALVVALASESIDRRVDKALGLQIEESEYQARTELRYTRVLAREDWTNVIKERYFKLYGSYPNSDIYKELTIKVNNQLFNQPHFKCNRDTMNPDQQKTIREFEYMLVRMSNKYPNSTPDDLINKALISF